MTDKEIVGNKRILAVDDEADVLEVIEEQLEEVELITAQDFQSAKDLLERESFDLVILDIMGVRGFDLLEIASEKRLPSVMLTAHSMTPASLQKAIDKGAVSFLPKDELPRLSTLVAEILRDVERGRTHWATLIKRLGPKFKNLWGEAWDEIKLPRDSFTRW